MPWIPVCYWPPHPGCLTKPKVLLIDCLAPQQGAMWTSSINDWKDCPSTRYHCDPSALVASLPDEPNYFLSPCLQVHAGIYRHKHTKTYSVPACVHYRPAPLSALFHTVTHLQLLHHTPFSFILSLFICFLGSMTSHLLFHWHTWPYKVFFSQVNLVPFKLSSFYVFQTQCWDLWTIDKVECIKSSDFL